MACGVQNYKLSNSDHKAPFLKTNGPSEVAQTTQQFNLLNVAKKVGVIREAIPHDSIYRVRD